MAVGGNAGPRPLQTRVKQDTHCLGGWLGPRPVYTGEGNLASTEIRSPDGQARVQWLCRLSYPAPRGIQKTCRKPQVVITNTGVVILREGYQTRI